MKRLPLAAFLFVLGPPLVATETGPGKVSAVTLYPQSALVQREATVSLRAGLNEVELAGLPVALIEETLQVSGRGAMAVRILDVGVALKQDRAPRNERLRERENQLTDLRDRLSALQDEDTISEASQVYLERIQKFHTEVPDDGGDSEVAPALWQERMRFQEEEMKRILAQRRSIKQSRRDLEKEIRKVEQEISQLKTGRDEVSKTVTVKLEANAPGDFDLELQYMVLQASWKPSYLVRVDQDAKTLELELRAALTQTSGEDWTDVAMTLSTARPRLDASVPAMDPWRLVRYDPRVRQGLLADEDVVELSPFEVSSAKRSRGYSGVTSNSMSARAMEPPPPPQEAVRSEAEAQAGFLATNFALPFAVSLPSEASPQSVRVTTIKTTCDLYHWALPRIVSDTYLKARANNPADFPLLPGRTQVFLDGRFVASSEIEFLAPGEEMSFLLGPSPQVAIERKEVGDLTEDVGFGGKTTRRTYRYDFEITNHDDAPTRLVMRDQIPLSTHEDIKVKLLRPDPDKVELEQDTGTVIWRLELAPGETRHIPFAFQVEHPKDWALRRG